MPPAIIAAGIGAAGAIGGGILANKGASKAAKATVQASNQAGAVQTQTYNQNQAALAPWQQQGLAAGNTYNALLGLAPQDQQAQARDQFRNFISNSDYGFQFDQGANAVNSGYAGAGTLQSGAAMRGLEDYRQGLQSGYRGQYMGMLGNQQQLGFGAASAQAGVGQNFANSMSNIYQNQGDNLANAALLKAQNNSQMFNSLAMLGSNAFGGMK
jgi:hypothetical protein